MFINIKVASLAVNAFINRATSQARLLKVSIPFSLAEDEERDNQEGGALRFRGPTCIYTSTGS
jgi:hypothetical protein